MTADQPTDEYCGDYEYVTDYQGGRFIVNSRGEYRLHHPRFPRNSVLRLRSTR